MRKSIVALLLILGAGATLASTAFARVEELGGDDTPTKLVNAQMISELRSAVVRSGVSGPGNTTYIGFVPGKVTATNYWGLGKGNYIPYSSNVADYGYWSFDNDAIHNNIGEAHGDSLFGWWPRRSLYTSTGGLTLPDDQRPWWAIDIGNNANYVINAGAAHARTDGVVGVWHVDRGSALGGGVSWNTSNWGGTADQSALWCGVRRNGDLSVSDPITGNPFNARILRHASGVAGGTTGGGTGTNEKFPGYAGQWDQMAYKDVDVTGASSITVRFKLRTNMSTARGTATGTKTGWFDKDPLDHHWATTAPNNFISSSAAGTSAPVDSFMVYVGAGVGYAAGSSWVGSDLATHSVYDPMRRWFSEVLRVNEPAVPYHEVYTTYGNRAATTVTTLTAPVDASWDNKARIVFRNKTNRGFDDEGGSVAGAYSSLGAGAAVIDDIEVDTGSGFTTILDFETAGQVDNDVMVDPLDAMKTTGKPMGVFPHAHDVLDMNYDDLCGAVGTPLRTCNLTGQVISAGDHDFSERAGGDYDTADQERNDGFESPTINFVNGGGTNEMDIDAAIADATEDYYLFYDMYTGNFDFVNQGNAWRFGFAAYPATQSDNVLTWGNPRYPGFIFFNPDKQCFLDFEGAKANGLLRYNSAFAEGGPVYPDSLRMLIGKLQQCFRFGITSADCSPTDGCYWDNMALGLVDGAVPPMAIDIWQMINDTFTVNGINNRANVLVGGADFDTTTALVKIGLNINQTTNTNDRYNVPGDTSTVNADGNSFRMDLLFRIAPGPGNYDGRNANNSLRLVPTGTATCDVSAPQASPANFWEQYLLDNGAVGTGGNGAVGPGHPVGNGTNGGRQWSKLVWNSARMDTAEVNLWVIDTRGIGLPANGLWSTMYEETDPKFTVLGIDKNRCFLIDPTFGATQLNITCNLVATPTSGGWEAIAGYPAGGENGLAYGHTYEYTKILPDGQFTPGTHTEYFFRRQDTPGSGGPCETAACLGPDTTIVFPQASEGSTDSHRWQEFSVLPDAWKFDSYGGLGGACMLYIDANDRRGNERVWVSVADTIGATAASKYGAHNGWHAAGIGTAEVNNPTTSFVYDKNEQPGTTWDMFGHKASESLNSRAGTIGVWNSNHSPSLVDEKWSTLGPSIGMLEAYYKVLLILSGDLNSTILGPSLNYSADDVQMIQDFMAGGLSSDHRGVFVEGDGFVEANAAGAQLALMTDWFKVSLRDPSYLLLTKNSAACVDLKTNAPISIADQGVRNGCTFTDDVLTVEAGGAEASRYFPTGVATPNTVSGVFHDVQGSEFYQSLVDGWDIENLRSQGCDPSTGRQLYYYAVLTNIFGKICSLTGGSPGVNDVPNGGAQEFVDFMNLRNNPLVTGEATVELGISKADRVEVKVFDVSGRLVRTLADRQFAPGKYTLKWDGLDNGGRQVARGVFFTQVKYVNSKFTDARKLTVLK